MDKKSPTSRIFGFKNKYPQSFLDSLAKVCGFKWTKVKAKTYSKDIEVKPLPPPSNSLFYFETKYGKE